MWSKLSLTVKGLILVSAPLLSVAFFVCVLVHFQQQAELEAQKAIEARNISYQVTKLTTDLYTLYVAVSDVGPKLREGKLSLSYRPVLDHIVAEYGELDKATANLPEINRPVRDSMKQVLEARGILNQGLKDIEAGNLEKVMTDAEEKGEQLKKILHGVLSQDLFIVAKHEQMTAAESGDRQLEISKNVMRLSYGILVTIAVFTVFSFLFFSRTVVARLNVMGDNVSRLASDKPLNDPLPGNDEIAKLDKSFHDMADTIIEVSRMKEELVGMLTHDLRTPLTFIQGCLDMMTQGMLGELNDRGKKLVKLANRNSFLMMGLINDLLDSQKIQSSMMTLETDEVCVAELFEEVKDIVEDWVEEHGITIKVQDTDLFVSGDQEKLSRVLLNLVSNAVKYSKQGDTIMLSARPMDSFAEVMVSDQGPGIPKEMLKAVFDRFQQVGGDKQAKKGSGLGLAICKELVTLHGGRIWATSERGQGTVFHFTLPLS